ncbi:MAG: hydroxymethylglutaryl-CoA reductase [Gaiellaceae bacterium]|jgi:hydroxymethylglutaryl-CoA reductase (NADPH)|nr:hydroxymethylglutaryl-CoA reductase [Gaiellaceae bacterium]
MRKWPRKNDSESIKARQEALGLDGAVTEIDLEPFARAQEMLTGAAVIPVSVVGPLELELGEYELREADGAVVETGRARDSVLVPLAHTEGGLSASLHRGALAVAESGGFRTYVLADRITRASCFVCGSAAEAIELAAWVEDQLSAMQDWLAAESDSSLSKFARLREVKTHVVGPMCHVLWRWTTGDAVGANMMTRNSYVLNMGYVMERAPVKPERAILEANMGGDKKPSFEYFQSGHGKTVLAETTLTEDAVRQVLRTKLDDLAELAWAGTHGAVASGMQSVAFTPASAIAALFAATGQDLGMVGTSSMAHGAARRVEGGLQVSIRLPGLEVATIGGGTTLPYARRWLEVLGCAGAGGVYRFAQIVAAATLSLEISASAAMATAGSAEFFRAHHERGGLR